MRTWPGLAAIGAGLIHLGSAAGTAPAVLVPLAVLGAAEMGWGVAALARPVPPAPRLAWVGVGAALLLTVVALLLPPAALQRGSVVAFGVPAGAFAGAGALDLAVGVLLAVQVLLGPPREPRPLPFLLAAGGAAAAVAIVTTQSLAATSVGGGMPMH